MTTTHTKTSALGTRVIVSQPKQVYNPCTPHTLIEVQDRRMGQLDMRRVPLFADLTDAQLETLIRDFSRRQFRQDEAIFQQGDPGQALYMVESGQVRIYVQDEEGQETSVILCGPGDLFGELALIDGLPRSASAVAMEDTVVLALSHDRFREQMRRYPQMALNLMKALSVRVRYNTQQVGSLTLLDIAGSAGSQTFGAGPGSRAGGTGRRAHQPGADAERSGQPHRHDARERQQGDEHLSARGPDPRAAKYTSSSPTPMPCKNIPRRPLPCPHWSRFFHFVQQAVSGLRRKRTVLTSNARNSSSTLPFRHGSFLSPFSSMSV